MVHTAQEMLLKDDAVRTGVYRQHVFAFMEAVLMLIRNYTRAQRGMARKRVVRVPANTPYVESVGATGRVGYAALGVLQTLVPLSVL